MNEFFLRIAILRLSSETMPDRSRNKFFQVFWGGPDRSPRCLRDLLEERIHQVPAGGEILWLTYYFRDEGLAEALLQARRRGVRVRVVLEGMPRTQTANDRVKELLYTDDGLGDNLRVISHNKLDKKLKRSRLHEKLYYFSHPEPSVFVGTFNPSGSTPEDPEIISEIGDQDRGHNMLAEVSDQTLVLGLYAHAERLFRMLHGPWERFLPVSNRVLISQDTQVVFFPRMSNKVLYRLFSNLDSESRLRIAVSHLNDPDVCKIFFDLIHRGVQLEILTHDTERRVPSWVEEKMIDNGADFKRFIHSESLPMHNKFMLIDTPLRQTITFGSMNLSERSLHVNHELLIISGNPELYQVFSQRWDEMSMEIKA